MAREHFVEMWLENQRYALHLHQVERVVHAAALTPLPGAPKIVSGAINIAGEVLPALNLRRRFGLPERPLCPTDQLVIARTSLRKVALIVDAVTGVLDLEAGPAPVTVLPHLAYVEGVLPLADGLVLVHDLDRFLSLDEALLLAEALATTGREA